MWKTFLIGLLSVCFALTGFTTSNEPAAVERLEKTYKSQIGVSEDLGANDAYAIRGYLLSTGFDYPVPWCAAFVSWCHTLSGIENPRSAWSPAWFPAKYTIYIRGRPRPGAEPGKGDVFGLYYNNLGRIGHVGFIDEWPPGEYCITVEGNTNSAGSREGDGVHRKRRLKKQIYKVSRWHAFS
jgi:hypothetical protein